LPHTKTFSLPKTFSINFDGIDAEHDELVEILNQFADKLDDGYTKDFETSFVRLLHGLETHFENEEAYMEALNYPSFRWHREHHQKSIETCKGIHVTCQRSGMADTDAVRVCFHEVVMDIARADLKFKEFVIGLENAGEKENLAKVISGRSVEH